VIISEKYFDGRGFVKNAVERNEVISGFLLVFPEFA
jgi:hypothetical protein